MKDIIRRFENMLENEELEEAKLTLDTYKGIIAKDLRGIIKKISRLEDISAAFANKSDDASRINDILLRSAESLYQLEQDIKNDRPISP
jgi:hypothetical protein